MNIDYTEPGDDKRRKVIASILPPQTLISSILEPEIESRLFDVIESCIKHELGIYRQYPKRKSIKEPAEVMLKTFDPRNNETCFMGKQFKGNGDSATDAELTRYRKAIGTIHHPVWGNCTLLEIWGGDHFEDHNEMVTGAFKYGMNLSDECPDIKVFVNPLFQNKKSKAFILSESQQQYKDWTEELLAKAMVFGVKEPKQAIKDRQRRK